MPSRKRSKGQARKANDKAILRERVFEDDTGQCHHGAVRPLPVTHVCKKFHAKFDDALNRGQPKADEFRSFAQCVCTAAAVAITNFPEVVKQEELRSYIVDMLLSSGARFLLEAAESENKHAAGYAGAILLIEYCADDKNREGMIRTTERGGIIVAQNQHYLKMRKVMDGCPRSVLRFYSKRLGCSCLDAKYSEARKYSTIGLCDDCDEWKKRSSLKLCGFCRAQQYCSQACQKSAWRFHQTRICQPCRGITSWKEAE